LKQSFRQVFRLVFSLTAYDAWCWCRNHEAAMFFSRQNLVLSKTCLPKCMQYNFFFPKQVSTKQAKRAKNCWTDFRSKR